MMENKKEIRIVFDGPPSHESGRFVEVENEKGEGIRFGEWRQVVIGSISEAVLPDELRLCGPEKKMEQVVSGMSG